MNELSLFSGAGGGLLGSKLLGWRTIGYVEFNEYCQKIIKQRIADGILDAAPIFGDIRKFISEGYTESYSEMVDVITAGFPCPAFSVAGLQEGADSDKNFWPETWECIRIIRPRAVFLENVPGLLSSSVEVNTDESISYLGSILGDLAEIGYDNIRYCVLGADDVGAPHRRKRLWILADSRLSEPPGRDKAEGGSQRQSCGEPAPQGSGDVAHSPGQGLEGHLPFREGRGEQGRFKVTSKGFQRGQITWWDTDPADLGNAEQTRCDNRNEEKKSVQIPDRGSGKDNGKNGPIKPRLGRIFDELAHRMDETGTFIKGPVPRVASGQRNRVDRLKAIGNGQVPQTVRAAWEILNQ